MRFERPILFSGDMVKALYAGKTQTRRLVDMGKLRVVPRFDVKPDHHVFDSQRVAGLADDYPGGKREVKGGKPVRAHLAAAGAVFAILEGDHKLGLKPREFDFICPYAQGQTYLIAFNQWLIVPADSWLWVREAWKVLDIEPPGVSRTRRAVSPSTTVQVGYPAGGPYTSRSVTAPSDDAAKLLRWKGKNRPGIHMYRWASRNDLRVSCVRLERLQDITEEDARAEGVVPSLGFADDQPIIGDRHHRTHGTHPYTLAFAVKWDEINHDRALFSDDPWVWVVHFDGDAR